MFMTFSKQVTPQAVSSGNTLTYTLNLTVLNNAAFNTVVTDILPAHLTYLGPGTNNPSSLPNPTVSYAAVTQLTWTLPPLSPGNMN